MGKITFTPSLSNLKSLEDLASAIAQIASNLKAVINGNLTPKDNFRTQLVEINFLIANSEVRIPHNLGSPIEGAVDWGTKITGDLYFSTTPSTNNFVYLKSTVVGTRRILLYA